MVGLITSSRHDYVQEACLYRVRKFTYPHYDYVVVDLDEDYDNYFHLLNRGFNVIKMEYSEPSTKRLAAGREAIRQIAIKENYDYILYMDADLIAPVNIIERMMVHDKDCVGFLYNYGVCPMNPSYPSIARTGFTINRAARTNMDKLDLYTWDEVYELLYPRCVRCYGAGIGLIKRKVFLEVPWRFCPDNIGEDVQYWHECNDKKFEWWCDTSLRLDHLNTDWNAIFEGEHKCQK